MSDWTTQAADAVEKAVVLVRDKTVVPAERGARMFVYGLLTAFFVLTAFLLVTVMLFRVLVIFVPVWAAWLIVGGIFVVAGLFCWTLRARKGAEVDAAA
jgi:hypothetical protein